MHSGLIVWSPLCQWKTLGSSELREAEDEKDGLEAANGIDAGCRTLL